jgi:hypothetical protein
MALTTAGKTHIASAIVGAAVTAFNGANAYLGVGNGTAAFAVGQTDLQGASKHRELVDSISATGLVITAVAALEAADANHAIEEFALFNASTSGTMLNRFVESHGVKASGDVWTITHTLTFT